MSAPSVAVNLMVKPSAKGTVIEASVPLRVVSKLSIFSLKYLSRSSAARVGVTVTDSRYDTQNKSWKKRAMLKNQGPIQITSIFRGLDVEIYCWGVWRFEITIVTPVTAVEASDSEATKCSLCSQGILVVLYCILAC